MNIEAHKYQTGLEIRMLEHRKLELQNTRHIFVGALLRAKILRAPNQQQQFAALEQRAREDYLVVAVKLLRAYGELEKHRQAYDVVRKRMVEREATAASASPAPQFMSGDSSGAPVGSSLN